METGRRPREGRGGARKRLVITDCEVTPVDAHGFGYGVRGVATITLNNALVLRSLRIIKDRDGELTVAYPTQMGRDRIHYDLVEPKSDSLRGEISRRVVAEFHRVVEQAEAPDAAGLEPAAPAPAEDVPEPTPPETTPEPTPAEVSSEQPDAEAASGPAPAETVPEEPTPPRY